MMMMMMITSCSESPLCFGPCHVPSYVATTLRVYIETGAN